MQKTASKEKLLEQLIISLVDLLRVHKKIRLSAQRGLLALSYITTNCQFATREVTRLIN